MVKKHDIKWGSAYEIVHTISEYGGILLGIAVGVTYIGVFFDFMHWMVGVKVILISFGLCLSIFYSQNLIAGIQKNDAYNPNMLIGDIISELIFISMIIVAIII